MGDIGPTAKEASHPLPDYLIPDKYLLNMYLLNPILVNNLVPGAGAYRIRPPNAPAWGRMIGKSGTCWGVFFCALHEPGKYFLNTYLLNPMFGKDGIRH